MDFLTIKQDGCFYCPKPGQSPLFPEETNLHIAKSFDALDEPFVKFLFLTDNKMIRQTVSELEQKKYPGVQFCAKLPKWLRDDTDWSQ